VGGAGLGLSICERLADLMGTEITLKSEPRVGSKFAVTLELAVAETPDVQQPQLAGAIVLVRSPHPELTENICIWLRYWGARAAPAIDQLLPGNDEAILLDVQRSSPGEALEWHGPILAVYLSGEVANGAVVDAYSLSSIGYGIGQLLNGDPPNEQFEMALPQFHLRVLVADDHPLNQVTLQGQLELLGCEVQLAGDGEEALAQWDITPYDLVLTDVNMPYLNGYDLARKLRAEGATVPIIGVTANAMLDEERRCVEAGMNAWLVKPIELRTLVEILRKYSHSGHNQLESNDDRDFKHVEPNVLNKHRDIFLSTMAEDMRQLEQGMADGDAGRVATALHRMRAALALAHHRALAAQMAAIELHMQTQGLDEHGKARMSAIVADIRQVLNNIALI
jgi:two-component system capsular synthesis sensor histidine kinase RcsC